MDEIAGQSTVFSPDFSHLPVSIFFVASFFAHLFIPLLRGKQETYPATGSEGLFSSVVALGIGMFAHFSILVTSQPQEFSNVTIP